jgi:hypothetical protein
MAKTRSKTQEGHYAKYKTSNRFATNRARKLAKLIKLQPNNEQLPMALKDMRKARSTPLVPKWSHTAISDAKMFADFKKGNDALESAMKKAKPVSMHQMFNLGMRAHDREGNLVWS